MTFDRFEVNRVWISCLIVIGVGLSIYMTTYVWRHADRPPDTDPRGDFSFFYTASQAMTRGQDIYTAKPIDKDRPGYIYPPLIAFLYQPLTRLTVPWAARMSLLVNVSAVVMALAFAARALISRLGRTDRWQVVLAVAVLAALLSFDKIKGELQMLQTNALIMLGMALGLYLLDRRPFWAGAALGFAMNIKYQAIALLLYLLFRKRWKALGAAVIWTFLWAFLPALSVGLSREADYLVRGFSGVLRLVGLNLGDDVANVEPISSGFSVSITSATARYTEEMAPNLSPFIIAGAVACAWLAVLVLLLRAHRLRVFKWPNDAAQHRPPWNGIVGIEYAAVIASVLAFSPQTNMRHMVLTSLVNVLGVAVAWEARGKNRWIALAGLAVLWMGLNLPPGHRVDGKVTGAVAAWHVIGGPTFSLLFATGIIIWAGLTVTKMREAETTCDVNPGISPEPPHAP